MGTLLLLSLLVVGALAALAGVLMIVVAAFEQSVMWGLAVIFLPGAGLIFCARHWDESRRGMTFYASGLATVIVLSVLVFRTSDERNAEKDAAKVAAEKAAMMDIKCPPAPAPPRGFSLWCCTTKGWTAKGASGCSTTYKPTETCDESKIGSNQIAVCSSIGVGPAER